MSPREPTWADLVASPSTFLGFGFGAGLAPVAPGTFGSLVAIPLVYLLSEAGLAVYLGVTLAVILFGIPICERSARRLDCHDHPGIVWDEIAGMLVTFVAAPTGWIALLLGFGLFRFFDIVKPWPIRWLDRHIRGGLGIMIDDIIAGLFAAALLQLGFAWLGSP